MSKCSAVQLRQREICRNSLRLPYFYRIDRRFAKLQIEEEFLVGDENVGRNAGPGGDPFERLISQQSGVDLRDEARVAMAEFVRCHDRRVGPDDLSVFRVAAVVVQELLDAVGPAGPFVVDAADPETMLMESMGSTPSPVEMTQPVAGMAFR
jgi:hypothetical protein